MVVVATVDGGLLRQERAVVEPDVVRMLVSRLDLEGYKATLKGLTQFGDRRQGTKRNRDAIDWIESQLQAVGCATTERLDYVYDPAPRARRPSTPVPGPERTPSGGRVGRDGSGPGGASIFGYRAPGSAPAQVGASSDAASTIIHRVGRGDRGLIL